MYNIPQEQFNYLIIELLKKIASGSGSSGGGSIYDYWDKIVGNSRVLTYYTDTDGGNNPSGNTNNIRTVLYKTGASTILTQLIKYDINDNVLSVTPS